MTRSFLRVPSPWTVAALGGSSTEPSGMVIAARCKEGPHAVSAQLAVDVPEVVRRELEEAEGLAQAGRALAEEGVEHLLPGCRVDPRRLGQDAVEIEQAAANVVGHESHPATLQPKVNPAGRRLVIRAETYSRGGDVQLVEAWTTNRAGGDLSTGSPTTSSR